jgi:hypothetical protein
MSETPRPEPGGMARLLREPFDDTLDGMALALEGGAVRATGLIALGAIAGWFVYVPIHELLHVAGCLVTGGSVSELELDPLYGGTILARVFPFVTPGGEYAGRLSGFDTGGSDLVYLATDLGPYLLSIYPGVAMLVACTHRARPLLFGVAVVLGLAPLYNVPGDYYEMASIVTTRLAAWMAGAGTPPPFQALRSDDVVALIGRVIDDPEALGLGSGSEVALAGVLIALSLVLAVVLALLTYRLGSLLAPGRRRAPAPAPAE